MQRKAPTTREAFEDATELMPEVIADTVLGRLEPRGEKFTEEEAEWFAQHASLRLRYVHANNDKARKRLDGPGNTGRDEAYKWIEHWFAGFELDKERYKHRNPDSLYAGEEEPCT